MIDKNKYTAVYSILFGEGLMNDAVSVILFKAVTLVAPTKESLEFNFTIFGKLIWSFLYISISSLFVGLFFGFIHAFTLKEMRHISHKPHFEIGLTIFFGLMSYLLGEVL